MMKKTAKSTPLFLKQKGQGNVPGPFLLLSDRKS